MSFGLFLAITVIYDQKLHGAAVLAFCLFSIIHNCLKMLGGYNNIYSTLCLLMGIIGLFAVGLSYAPVIGPIVAGGIRFYFWECFGLTGILLYTPVLVLCEAKEREAGKPHQTLCDVFYPSNNEQSSSKSKTKGRKKSKTQEGIIAKSKGNRKKSLINKRRISVIEKRQKGLSANDRLDKQGQKFNDKKSEDSLYKMKSKQKSEVRGQKIVKERVTNNFLFFMTVAGLLPTFYIWLLPELEDQNYASHIYQNEGVNQIAKYLTTPQANGAFIACFYFTLIIQWDAPIFAKDYDTFYTSQEFISLFGFEVLFQLSCVFTLNYAPITHYVFYLFSAAFLLWHKLLQYQHGICNKYTEVIHPISITAIFACIIIWLLSEFTSITLFHPYYIYLESVILTGIIWNVPLLFFDTKKIKKLLGHVRITRSWLDYYNYPKDQKAQKQNQQLPANTKQQELQQRLLTYKAPLIIEEGSSQEEEETPSEEEVSEKDQNYYKGLKNSDGYFYF